MIRDVFESYDDDDDDDDEDDEVPTLLDLSLSQNPEVILTPLEAEESSAVDEGDQVVPVTILSGFLGSGKTCLIQYILRSSNHGKKIAVIENEFSGAAAASVDTMSASEREQGLSIETIIARDGTDNSNLTDLIELPNGCICCTVKDSLVETLENLLQKKRDLNYIIIECSGMANPGPIASIFWLDDALGSRIRLDGVVVCVDARNVEMQLRETRSQNHGFMLSKNDSNSGEKLIPSENDLVGGDEAAQQIAFADRIIINKVDLLQETEDIKRVISLIRGINSSAPIRKTTFSQISDLDWILDAKCFDVERAKDVDIASPNITTNEHEASMQPCLEPECVVCPKYRKTKTSKNIKPITLEGQPLLFCAPVNTTLSPLLRAPPPRDSHSHTSSISTVALIEKGSVNIRRMNAWLASILWPDQDENNQVLQAQLHELEKLGRLTSTKLIEQRRNKLVGKMRIFRIKGILSVKHSINEVAASDKENMTIDANGLDSRKYIVQAVNDLWEIHAASKSLNWDSDEVKNRLCKLVVIGRYLDRSALNSGFASCLVLEQAFGNSSQIT